MSTTTTTTKVQINESYYWNTSGDDDEKKSLKTIFFLGNPLLLHNGYSPQTLQYIRMIGEIIPMPNRIICFMSSSFFYYRSMSSTRSFFEPVSLRMYLNVLKSMIGNNDNNNNQQSSSEKTTKTTTITQLSNHPVNVDAALKQYNEIQENIKFWDENTVKLMFERVRFFMIPDQPPYMEGNFMRQLAFAYNPILCVWFKELQFMKPATFDSSLIVSYQPQVNSLEMTDASLLFSSTSNPRLIMPPHCKTMLIFPCHTNHFSIHHHVSVLIGQYDAVLFLNQDSHVKFAQRMNELLINSRVQQDTTKALFTRWYETKYHGYIHHVISHPFNNDNNHSGDGDDDHPNPMALIVKKRLLLRKNGLDKVLNFTRYRHNIQSMTRGEISHLRLSYPELQYKQINKNDCVVCVNAGNYEISARKNFDKMALCLYLLYIVWVRFELPTIVKELSSTGNDTPTTTTAATTMDDLFPLKFIVRSHRPDEHNVHNSVSWEYYLRELMSYDCLFNNNNNSDDETTTCKMYQECTGMDHDPDNHLLNSPYLSPERYYINEILSAIDHDAKEIEPQSYIDKTQMIQNVTKQYDNLLSLIESKTSSLAFSASKHIKENSDNNNTNTESKDSSSTTTATTDELPLRMVDTMKKEQNVLEQHKQYLLSSNFALLREDFLRRFIVVDYPIEQEHISNMYTLSNCLFHPSKFEGFGVPIAEAQCHGCPVVTCCNKSLVHLGAFVDENIDPHYNHFMMETWYDISPPDAVKALFDMCVQSSEIQRAYSQVVDTDNNNNNKNNSDPDETVSMQEQLSLVEETLKMNLNPTRKSFANIKEFHNEMIQKVHQMFSYQHIRDTQLKPSLRKLFPFIYK